MKFFNAQSSVEKDMITDLQKSIVRNVTINEMGLVIIGVTFIVAMVAFLHKKDKSSTDQKILLLGSIILQVSVVLLLVSKQAYFKALYPLIFLVLVYVYAEFLGGVKTKHSIKAVSVFVVISMCLYSCCSFVSAITVKKTEGENTWAIEKVLSENKTEDLIFVRGTTTGYEICPYLENYKNTLVITTTKATWEGFEETVQFITADAFTVLVSNSAKVDIELLEWLSDSGFTLQTLLYEDDSYTVYSVLRDR